MLYYIYKITYKTYGDTSLEEVDNILLGVRIRIFLMLLCIIKSPPEGAAAAIPQRLGCSTG